MKRIALLLCLAVVGCASVPVTPPYGPGGAINPIVDPDGGAYLKDEGKALWVSEGVPAEWFTATPQGWHLSKLLYHRASVQRVNHNNP